MSTPTFQITIVGDGVVGKTCLLIVYKEGRFPEQYVPTIFDHYMANVVVDGNHYAVTLCDTAGQEEFDRLRPLSYPETDCFVLCFTVERKLASYVNIDLKWIPEIKHYKPDAPILLVGTKCDLRSDPQVACYTPEDGRKLRKKVKADSYLECSAKLHEGLDSVFEEAVKLCLKPRTKNPTPRQKCVLL